MNYYCVKQHDITDCGAACLATIAKQKGYNISIAAIREIAGTDRHGTNAYGIIKAAEKLGFTAQGVKGDREAFFTEFPLPCIAHMIVDGSLMHYVVVHKITKQQVIIADPAVGIVKLTPEEFFGNEDNHQGYQWTGVLIFLEVNENFQKGDETTGIFEHFFKLLHPQRKLLAHIFVCSLIYTILGIMGAFYFKVLVDSVLPNGLRATLAAVSVGVIILSIFKVILEAFRSQLLLYLSQKLDIDLLLGYYRHVIGLPLHFFGTRRVGEMIARFNDAGKVRDAISGAALTIMIDTLMALAGAVILYLQSPKLFLIALMMVIFYVVIVVSFHSRYEKLNRKEMEDNAALTSYLVESLNGIQTIKAYNAEQKVKLNAEKKFVRLLKSVFRLGFIGNIQSSLKTTVELIGEVLILWAGSISVINGQMTIGALITFNSLLVYFLTPVKNLINLQPQVQTAVVAADRLGEILTLDAEKTEKEWHKISPENICGDIEMRSVNFRYGTRRLVLEDINFKIHKGEKVAFIGESGSGKTTLSKLLLYMYVPESGDIMIGDYNIEDIRIETLRERIAYIPQETFLFSGSIRDNLTLGAEEIEPEEILNACRMAQAHSFINELPLRYDTLLEENGANLSGGQRQRLAIARALLKKPDILILDEATSHLDSITEKALESTINEFSGKMTVIMIAHRLSTVKNCDRIFVLEKGRIVESGTPEELKKIGGRYAGFLREQQVEKVNPVQWKNKEEIA